jgi:hypothetical protein
MKLFANVNRPLRRGLYAILTISAILSLTFGCSKIGKIITGIPVPPDSLPVPACIAYVEVNNNNLDNMGCFTLNTGKPIVNVATIFAANINYLNENHSLSPVVSLNPQVDYLLTQTTYVKDLQAKGIKVTMSLLNNHDYSGWSQFGSQAEADSFAKSVQVAVTRFGIDGIEIDDEYADSAGTTGSIPMVVRAIRQLLPNIIIGYYLYSDDGVNPADVLSYQYADKTKFSDLITYAIGNFGDPLSEYTGSIAKTKLFYESSSSTVGPNAVSAKSNGYGGVMLFSANGSSLSAFNSVAQAFYGDSSSVTVPSGCLQPDQGQQAPNAPALTYIY